VPWRIEWDGEVYRGGDLTVDQAEQICELTKQSWRYTHPAQSPTHAKAVIAVCHSARTGAPVDEIMRKVGALTVDAVLDCIHREDSDLPTTYEDGLPKSAADPSTAESSTSPTSTDGPLTSSADRPSAT
jgi:hypothetical protein